MKVIRLTKGEIALVDDDVYDELARYKWCLVGGYPARHVPCPRGKCIKLYMHHAVMGKPPTGLVTDHIDGNRLNNTRANLRFCTHKENLWNQGPRAGGSSKYKGVSWHDRDKRWQAEIRVDGKYMFLGNYLKEEDAARAHDIAAIKHRGEFAFINFTTPK